MVYMSLMMNDYRLCCNGYVLKGSLTKNVATQFIVKHCIFSNYTDISVRAQT